MQICARQLDIGKDEKEDFRGDCLVHSVFVGFMVSKYLLKFDGMDFCDFV